MAAKKKNKRGLLLTIGFAVLIVVLIFSFIFRQPIIYYSKIVYHKIFAYQQHQSFKDNQTTNLNGEVYVPDYEVYGVDVSRHQGNIDWEKLAAFRFQYHKISFVYIKATESISWKDNNFNKNWRLAKKAGFYRGAYHFFDPLESPEKQMNSFFRIVKLKEGDLPPVLDVEQESRISKTKYRDLVLRCLKIMEKHYKLKPILYINQNFYDTYFATNDFKRYPLWLSRLKKSKPTQDNWIFWQFSHTAIVDGINEYVDLNAFKASEMDFKVLLME